MPTTKKKPPTKKKKPAPKKAPTVSPEEAYLLVLIAATERAIDANADGTDCMSQQAARLNKQLAVLRESK